jgi:hypothetical protein
MKKIRLDWAARRPLCRAQGRQFTVPETPMAQRSNAEPSETRCKRLTRLTYAFSKKWDNLDFALALHFAYYNFCRVHKTIKMTPAMASGLTDHVWTIAELLA